MCMCIFKFEKYVFILVLMVAGHTLLAFDDDILQFL